MELDEFVKVTLTQIASGVRDSLEVVRERGGYVNPAVPARLKNDSHFASLDYGVNVFLVDFDVAVTVAEDKGTNAAAKLTVASLLSLQAGGESGSSNTITNKISFKVPMALPVDEVTYEKRRSEEESIRIKLAQKRPSYNPME